MKASSTVAQFTPAGEDQRSMRDNPSAVRGAQTPSADPSNAAVCTLFEGDYHLGAGALINSLHAGGFSGTVVCGYRGATPPWAEAAKRLSNGLEVKFVPVETHVHFTYHKPEFLRQCWEKHTPAVAQLYYFDPDIVVKAPWSVLDRWAREGLALCEDVNFSLPSGHPYRLAWSDFLERHDLPVRRSLDRIYNAGFIGLSRAQAGFLEAWSRVIRSAERELGELKQLKIDKPHALFHTADQDALNMALMATTDPIHAAGPEGMDFLPGGHLLSHAIGSYKPWRGGYLKRAFRGQPPGGPQKSFFAFAEGPLTLFSSSELSRLRFGLRVAALIGRFYRRS